MRLQMDFWKTQEKMQKEFWKHFLQIHMIWMNTKYFSTNPKPAGRMRPSRWFYP